MCDRGARTKAVVATLIAGLLLGGFALTPPDAAATTYAFSSCEQTGEGMAPAGLDDLGVDVTGVLPATVERQHAFDVTPVTVVLENTSAVPIEGSAVSFSAVVATDVGTFNERFTSPSPFTIPAGGTFTFGGLLRYIAYSLPGTVLDVRAFSVDFDFGPDLSVRCQLPADAPPFASIVVVDSPGYQYTCEFPLLALKFARRVDMVGSVPATVPQGSRFTLSDVVMTTAHFPGVEVLSWEFSLAAPTNATSVSPLTVPQPLPPNPPPREPVDSPPMSFEFIASGPVGTVVDFLPGTITSELFGFGTAICTRDPVQDAFASTRIVAPVLDEVAAIAIRPGLGIAYAAAGRLTTGDFVFTRDAAGTLTNVTGAGSFIGPGGAATLTVRYQRPASSIGLRDPGKGVRLQALSFVPLVSPAGDSTVFGLAVGLLGGRPVVVLWFIRDTG